MLYFLGVIFILSVAFLLLRIRFRLELRETRRVMFFGVGRSGVETDFVAHLSRIKLFGMTISTRKGSDAESLPNQESTPVSARRVGARESNKKLLPASRRRKLSMMEWLEIGLKALRALRKYIAELYRSLRVEVATAEIHAGFESPDLTGQMFGYYHALIGAVPSLEQRVRFYPDWMGESFSGKARLSLAIPVYAVLGRTLVFLLRLPLLKIVGMIRNQRKGTDHVNEQCRGDSASARE